MSKFSIYAIFLIAIAGICFGREVKFASDKIVVIDEQIIPGSVFILCGGDTITFPDISVSPAGTIEVFRELKCDSITIYYEPLSDALPKLTRHRKLWGTGTSIQTQRTADTTSPEISFRTNGSLLRGLRISNTGEVNSTSSLQFQAQGDLPGDIHIGALLSDEGSPIQPEGRTLEISELDKVLIQLTSPHFGLSFGDIDLNFDGGNFLYFSRRIQGIQASVNYGGLQSQAFGSIMRGEYNSNEFTAQEGNQGPYGLTGANGERDIVVLAGSEKVWLNGELLRRGENNDYIMDYNLAQITFTNNRPVGANDRIVVDFQYISQDYARSFYGAGIDIKPSESANFGVSAAIQSDDTKNPLVELSDSVRDILVQSGDNVPDSLSAPQSTGIISTNARFHKGIVSLGGEYAFSDFDKNKFSHLDDGDNFGDAVSAAGTLSVCDWMKLFSATRIISQRFESLGRIDPADFNRDWNISQSTGDDKIVQGGFDISNDKLKISSWLGQRILGDQRAKRINLTSSLSVGKSNSSLISNYANSQNGTRLMNNLNFSISSGRLKQAKTSVESDYFDGDTLADTISASFGQNFDFDAKIVNFQISGKFLGYEIRRSNRWGDFSRTVELGGGLSGKLGSFKYTRRIFHSIDSAAGSSLNSDLISAQSSGKIIGVNISGNYQLSRSQSEILDKVYTYVGVGSGNYRWDSELGEYVYDSDGDYILEYQPTGEFHPVLRSDASFSTSAPMNFIPYNASFAGDFSFHSENQRDDIKSYYLVPSRIFTDDSLTSGNFSASGRVNFFQTAPINLIWSSSYDKSAYRIYSSGAEFSMKNSHTLTISGNLPLDISSDIDGGIEFTKSLRPTLEHWVDAKKLFSKISFSRKIIKSTRLRLETEYGSIVDRGTTPETNANQWSSTLTQTGLFGKFTIKSSAQYILLSSEATVLPYELSQGWYVGKNFVWDITVSYRAGKKTELSLIYHGEKKADTDTKHTAEARVRLLF